MHVYCRHCRERRVGQGSMPRRLCRQFTSPLSNSYPRTRALLTRRNHLFSSLYLGSQHVALHSAMTPPLPFASTRRPRSPTALRRPEEYPRKNRKLWVPDMPCFAHFSFRHGRPTLNHCHPIRQTNRCLAMCHKEVPCEPQMQTFAYIKYS